jgi:predicted PurR-regulated permease PerM
MSAQTSTHDDDDGRLTRRVTLAARVLVIAGLLVALVISAASVLLLLFAGILLAVFLRSCAEALADRTPISPGWGVVLVVIALLLVIGGGLAVTVPHAVSQFGALGAQLSAALETLTADLENSAWGRELLTLFPDLGDVQGQVGTALRNARGVFSTTLGVLLSLFLIIIIGLYLAADPRLYTEGLVLLMPRERRERARQVLIELRVTLFRWLVGRLVGMAVIGISTSVGLLLLGIPLPFTLGLLAALLTFIPNIGPVMAAVPAVVLAAVDGLDMMIWVVLMYTLIQALESYLLTPLVARRTVSLPPVVTMVVQILMGLYLGLLGVLLASPLAASALVMVKIYYLHDRLDADVTLRSAAIDLDRD